MLFKLFGTPILKYTNIDYQCVTNLSPKSDEDRCCRNKFFLGGNGAKKSVSTGLWKRTSTFVFVLLLVVRVYMIMKKVFSVYMLLFMSISATVPYGLQ